MSGITISLQAASVEAGDVFGGFHAAEPASQTLRFFNEAGACVLVMTLVWPAGTLACASLLDQRRTAGEND